MSSIKEQLEGQTTKLASRQTKIKDHPSVLSNYEDGSLYNVPIEQIKPNPDQPRQYFGQKALKELAQSIKQNGILQPVIIRRGDDGVIFLVAGERRLRAAKEADLEEIPSIFTNGNPAEIALIENLQRENLNPIEEAEALDRMIQQHDYTQEQLSNIIGKSRVTVTETLSLNNLPDQIKKECRRGDIYPKRLLRQIARQKTPKGMISLFNKAKKENLKSDQVKEIVKKEKRAPSEIAISRAISLKKSLNNINSDAIKEPEKSQLKTELNDLKNLIDQINPLLSE